MIFHSEQIMNKGNIKYNASMIYDWLDRIQQMEIKQSLGILENHTDNAN